LRDAFESGARDRGGFHSTDNAGCVRACAPNKVRLSDIVTVSSSTMLLPTDFQTRGGSAMAAIQTTLEKLIKPQCPDTGDFVEVDRDTAFAIIDQIEQSMEFDSVEFEWDAMRSLID
jgi:hypothetical protein